MEFHLVLGRHLVPFLEMISPIDLFYELTSEPLT
jgi:hypothetical protein